MNGDGRRPTPEATPETTTAHARAEVVADALSALRAASARWESPPGGCAECRRNPRWSGWRRCITCLRDYRDAINRRHRAELRMPRLEEAA